MKTGQQNGKVIELAAPYDRLSGEGALMGSIFGVATVDVLSGVSANFLTEGVVTIAKLNTEVWTRGQKIAWDDTNKRLTMDLSKGPMVGSATAATVNPSTTGSIKLIESPAPRSNNVENEGTSAPSSLATAGARTITAAEVLSGVYVRDCAGAARIDTLPTAALLVAAVPGAKVGDMLRLYVVNGSDAAEALTITEGAGGAFDANQTAASRVVPQNASKMVHIRLTNVTPAAEAYVVYA